MPTISPNGAATPDAIPISIAAGAGETTFDVEVNRSIDFTAEASLIWGSLAAAAHTLAGLNASTTYFIRARKTNGGIGPWSNVLAIATGQGAAVPAYSGFSIVPALLVVPEALTGLSSGNALAGYPASRLTRDDPTSAFVAGAGNITIDFETPGSFVDTFALLGTSFNQNVAWRIQGFFSASDRASGVSIQHDSGSIAFHTSGGLGYQPHYHGLYRAGVASTLRFWRITITGNSAARAIMRNLVVGRSRVSVNVSRGAGSTSNDLGRLARTRLGTPDRTRGWRSRNIDFELSWLTEAEYQAKWSDLYFRVGSTDPVLVVPNPKVNAYLNSRIGFGAIRQSRDENVRLSRYVKTIEVESIY